MNLVESIFRGGLGLRADASGTPAPWDDFWYQRGGGHSSSSGMRVGPETAKRLSTVIACVSYRGKAVAMLPCKIRKDLKGGGSKVLPKHPLYRVLAVQSNPVQTAYEFKYMMNAHVDLRGNAFARKVMQRGVLTELWPMHPDRVTVEVLRDSGKLLYRYNDPLTNETVTYVQEEIFHLRDWSDGMALGQSRIAMGLDVLGVAMARQDYMARFLRNDTRTGMVVSGTSFKTKEDEDQFRENWQKAHAQANRGKTLLLPQGLTIEQLSVDPVDAQLIEGLKASDTQICSIFGVLPHAVGVDAGKAATFASTEQFNIMNAQQCVHPMLVMWEQAIQRDLIDPDDDAYAKFSMAALLRGDNATRFAGYTAAINSGWLCPDDVRELEDLNPIAGGVGQTYWRSTNLLPLAELGDGSGGDGGANDGNDTADAGEDGAGGDSGSNARVLPRRARAALPEPAMQARLGMLATAAADRCVRKERSAVTRMVRQQVGAGEVAAFYAEHARFVAETLNLDAAAALTVKRGCEARGQELAALLADEDDEFAAGAQVWVETIAATEAAKLVALAIR